MKFIKRLNRKKRAQAKWMELSIAYQMDCRQYDPCVFIGGLLGSVYAAYAFGVDKIASNKGPKGHHHLTRAIRFIERCKAIGIDPTN
ncbi:MAG: hypothetical protein IT203_02690 [Fimbriimonadaceae bacterium]|nr:hypothetical protein [Fimbriimonadaceae bacterium]